MVPTTSTKLLTGRNLMKSHMKCLSTATMPTRTLNSDQSMKVATSSATVLNEKTEARRPPPKVSTTKEKAQEPTIRSTVSKI